MKIELTNVQSVDESLYLPFLGILYCVLQILSSKNNWVLNLPIDFLESLVNVENLL